MSTEGLRRRHGENSERGLKSGRNNAAAAGTATLKAEAQQPVETPVGTPAPVAATRQLWELQHEVSHRLLRLYSALPQLKSKD